jgi:Phage head-tail joining protein
MTVSDSITNALLRFGRPMTLRRLTWAGDVATPTDVSVYGVSEGLLSHELADGMAAPANVKVTFSNAQIAAASWPGPPRQLDQMIIDDGQVRTILGVETKYLGGTVLVFVCDVQALSYDRYIRIERATSVTDPDSGEPILTWAELATVVASKVDISGNEKFEGNEVSATVLTRFRVPWSATLSTLGGMDRIVHPASNGKIYDIQTVKEQQFKVGLEIFATARAD